MMIPCVLFKIKTREDAISPQRDKYPDRTTVATGFLKENWYPAVDHPFVVWRSKLDPIFRTSDVTEIIETNHGVIIFKTLNSEYKLMFNPDYNQ